MESKNITMGADGKYRWRYDMNLYRNPSVFLLIWKIFFWIFAAIFLLLLEYRSMDKFLKSVVAAGKPMLFIFLGFTALLFVAYLLYALLMGGKYCVEFEMDEEGVRHTQAAEQFKKAQKMGILTFFIGIAGKNPTAAGSGLLSASRNTMYSEFSKVKKVKAYPRLHIIKVNAPLCHNQVFAEAEDFDFVLPYIRARVPEKAVR